MTNSALDQSSYVAEITSKNIDSFLYYLVSCVLQGHIWSYPIPYSHWLNVQPVCLEQDYPFKLLKVRTACMGIWLLFYVLPFGVEQKFFFICSMVALLARIFDSVTYRLFLGKTSNWICFMVTLVAMIFDSLLYYHFALSTSSLKSWLMIALSVWVFDSFIYGILVLNKLPLGS